MKDVKSRFDEIKSIYSNLPKIENALHYTSDVRKAVCVSTDSKFIILSNDDDGRRSALIITLGLTIHHDIIHLQYINNNADITTSATVDHELPYSINQMIFNMIDRNSSLDFKRQLMEYLILNNQDIPTDILTYNGENNVEKVLSDTEGKSFLVNNNIDLIKSVSNNVYTTLHLKLSKNADNDCFLQISNDCKILYMSVLDVEYISIYNDGYTLNSIFKQYYFLIKSTISVFDSRTANYAAVSTIMSLRKILKVIDSIMVDARTLAYMQNSNTDDIDSMIKNILNI